MGLDWSDSFDLTNRGISAVRVEFDKQLQTSNPQSMSSNTEAESKISSLKQKYGDVFSNTLGKCTKMKVPIHLRKNVTPMFYNARPVPFSIKENVKEELDRPVKLGVLQKADFSEWAAPILS